MTLNDVATLIQPRKTSVDSDGYDVIEEERTVVPVEVRSVTRAEFYEAMKAGVSLITAFIMWACDYAGQPYLEHDGVLYKVERAYTGRRAKNAVRGSVGDMEIELYCSEVDE